MSKHLSTNKSDLSQKLSRQVTTRKHSSYGDEKRHSDTYGSNKKQPLKVKDKYKTWSKNIDYENPDDDDYFTV